MSQLPGTCKELAHSLNKRMKPYTFATHSLGNILLFYNIVQNQLVQISCSYDYGKLNFGDIQSPFCGP